ncbi:MAG: DUF2191 domain-containing protein [Candidatus Latescibacterota bacterium]|jgi:hypothetical protein
MKTTIDLPDALLRKAKILAARRGTTLKAMLSHALEREVNGSGRVAPAIFEVDADGLPRLPSRGARVTKELVSRLLEEESL